MNLQISARQAKHFCSELLLDDIKKFVLGHPKEYHLYLEEQTLLTNKVETSKISRKEESE